MSPRILRFFGIRKKLIFYFLVTIMLLGITSAFSYYNASTVLKNTDSIINDYSYLSRLKNSVNSLMTELEKYLTNGSSENLLNYYEYYNEMQELRREIPRTLEYDSDMLTLKDIGNMMDELMVETDQAVLAKRGRISSKYIAHFKRSNEISEYIRLYNNKLLDSKLRSGSDKYDNVKRNMSFIIYLNLLIIIGAVLINLFIAIVSTYRLTKPISQLSHTAEKIAEGDFDVEIAQTHTGDETDILAGAFIKMVRSVRKYIDEIKGQAEVEKRLKEQELQNLKMANLLKESELKFLQSQINPHFLYNTLNAASQLAMIEGADKSSEFMENVAQLFRYNLKNIEDLVPLREEVEHVKRYMNILKMRFGNRIEFFSSIDEESLDVRIPRITIQPIVENAYIHGLQNLERNGEIHLNVHNHGDSVAVEVIDNGMGMESKCIEDILWTSSGEGIARKHITGIGINNVIHRLQILFNIPDKRKLISIESKLKEGTRVVLNLPLKQNDLRGSEGHA